MRKPKEGKVRKPRSVSTIYGYWEISLRGIFVNVNDRYMRPNDCRKLATWLRQAAKWIEQQESPDAKA
jgi:hypothetical protein